MATAPEAAAPLRAAVLLVGLRLRRLLNQTSFLSRRVGGKGRAATPGKRRARWLVSAMVAVFMLLSFGNLSRQMVLNLHGALDPAVPAVLALPSASPGDEDADAEPEPPVAAPRQALAAGAFSPALTRGLAMELSLLVLVALFMTLGGRELAAPDWDLEWLVTLPLGRRTLLYSRIAERTLASPIGVLVLWPAASVLVWYSGLRWLAPLAGAAAALPLLTLAALGRTLVDTGLRLRLAPARLRNLQAALSIVSILLLYTAISVGTGAPPDFVLAWARAMPPWATWLPPGLVVRLLNAQSWPAGALAAVALLAQTGLSLVAGVALLHRLLRGGVVAAGSRESGRARRSRPAAHNGAPALLSPLQRRELLLLSRDRNFLVQTLVLPVIIVGSQLLLNGRVGGHSLSTVSDTAIAAVAFGIAAYLLMLSAFQTLNAEGGALWMLFTLPHRLDNMVAEKARLWAMLALVYPILVFTAGAVFTGHVDLAFVGLAAVVLLGVPIFTAIAVSLGVYACDPLAQEVRHRVRPTYVYLYTLLAGLYTYAIFTDDWSRKLVFILLCALLAMALWQKARDELPYLLDPAAAPPARVSTADGLIAAMVFFVLQGLSALALVGLDAAPSAAMLTLSFSLAGAITYASVRLTYWRSRTLGVPVVLGSAADGLRSGSVVAGIGAGGVAALGAVAYLVVLARLGVAPAQGAAPDALGHSAWLALLAVVAAPLFEEFIFRGLIFGGLRRTWGALPAIAASAAIFAIVHPALSMLPVFGLGVCAAWAYERTRRLLAPMLTHALYNAVVLAYQWPS